MWRGEREGGHRVERLGERREVLHPYRWSAVRHRGRRVHRGHDVQQVRDVAAVAPSEEVIGRPRHCALGVVAVVDRDEDDARRGGRDAVDGRRGARRTAGMVPEIDGGHAARAEGRRACGGVALLGSSGPTNSPSPARSLPPPSRQLFSFFSELVSGHENIEPSARRWTKPAPPALKTPRSRVMPNPTATFNTSEVRSRHA